MINLRKMSLQIAFTLLLFLTYLGEIFSSGILYMIFKHIDEAMTLVFLAYILINFKDVFRVDKKIILYWFLLCGIGLASNMTYKYQEITPVLIDFLIVCPRFLIGYYAASVYVFRNNIDLCKYVEPVCKIITSVLFILALHEIFFTPFFPKADFRYFMYSIQLMFPHVTYLAFSAVILLIFWGFVSREKNCTAYMLMSTFLALVTLRSKAIVFVVIYWILYMWFIKLNSKDIVFISSISAVLSAVLIWDNISLTFFQTSRFSPRLIMTRDGLSLMMKYFPVGTGFATYGTYMAQTYYSPLYEMLGYNELKGMSQDNALFLNDSFWPSIFAQFGVLGTILFVLILLEFVKKSLNMLKTDKYTGFSMLMCIAYLAVTSFAESAFWNPMAFLLMILFGAFEGYSNYCEKDNSCI